MDIVQYNDVLFQFGILVQWFVVYLDLGIEFGVVLLKLVEFQNSFVIIKFLVIGCYVYVSVGLLVWFECSIVLGSNDNELVCFDEVIVMCCIEQLVMVQGQMIISEYWFELLGCWCEFMVICLFLGFEYLLVVWYECIEECY